jgi:hypothetical protein
MNKFFFSPVKNKETTNATKKLKKNGFYPSIIYMSNEHTKKQFSEKVQNGDTVEIHADGLPWVTGGTHYDDTTDHNPFTLAKYFANLLEDKNIHLTIDLRFCTSGVKVLGPTIEGNLCFAEDFSKALAFHGYSNIMVLGYTAYINSEDPFRESLSEVGQSDIFGSKIKHCKLEDGQVVYRNGELVKDAKTVLVKDFSYDEAEVKKDDSLNKYLADRQEMFISEESENDLVSMETAPINQDLTEIAPTGIFDTFLDLEDSMIDENVDSTKAITPMFSGMTVQIDLADQKDLSEQAVKSFTLRSSQV